MSCCIQYCFFKEHTIHLFLNEILMIDFIHGYSGAFPDFHIVSHCGVWGALGWFGGSAEPKNDIIVLRPILALECIVLGHNNLLHYAFGVLGQNWALRAQKRPFWAKIGFAEKWLFLKNIGSNFDENA